MNFEEFVKIKKIRVGEKDPQKAKALVKMSDNNILTAENMQIKEESSSSIFGIYYEALRELVEAVSILNGYKIYSHEAFTSYLKKLKEERISELFDRFRKIRNGANYYGEAVSPEITLQAKKEIKKLCLKIKEKYLRGFER